MILFLEFLLLSTWNEFFCSSFFPGISFSGVTLSKVNFSRGPLAGLSLYKISICVQLFFHKIIFLDAYQAFLHQVFFLKAVLPQVALHQVILHYSPLQRLHIHSNLLFRCPQTIHSQVSYSNSNDNVRKLVRIRTGSCLELRKIGKLLLVCAQVQTFKLPLQINDLRLNE